MSRVTKPSKDNYFFAEHVALLTASFRHWTGKDLIVPSHDPVITAEQVFHAPFAVMSHDTAHDPVFNYANQCTLDLFEMQWSEFIRRPSRFSAEPASQADRKILLEKVAAHGFINGYSGTRITSTGRRFMINGAVIWNVIDCSGQICGQAAMFNEWHYY